MHYFRDGAAGLPCALARRVVSIMLWRKGVPTGTHLMTYHKMPVRRSHLARSFDDLVSSTSSARDSIRPGSIFRVMRVVSYCTPSAVMICAGPQSLFLQRDPPAPAYELELVHLLLAFLLT